MQSKFQVGLIFWALCSVLFIGTLLMRTSDKETIICACDSPPVYTKPLYLRSIDVEVDRQQSTLQDTLKDERDKLSKELNALKQKLGKMDCEKQKQTSSAGGWCKSISTEGGGQHKTDTNLIKELSKFLKGKFVGSFGDGPGAYQREMTKLGDVKAYDAYDGAPYCEETSEGRVKFMDLTVPQYGIRMYEWIISLEVAEHIPKEFEPVYIDNIVRHSKEGIILSWAVPGQGGLAHINNRPLSYVVDLMKIHGFSHDTNSSKGLQLASTYFWLRQNVNVFRRVNTTDIDVVQKWYT